MTEGEILLYRQVNCNGKHISLQDSYHKLQLACTKIFSMAPIQYYNDRLHYPGIKKSLIPTGLAPKN